MMRMLDRLELRFRKWQLKRALGKLYEIPAGEPRGVELLIRVRWLRDAIAILEWALRADDDDEA